TRPEVTTIVGLKLPEQKACGRSRARQCSRPTSVRQAATRSLSGSGIRSNVCDALELAVASQIVRPSQVTKAVAVRMPSPAPTPSAQACDAATAWAHGMAVSQLPMAV